MKRILQVLASIAALSAFIWGTFFSHWQFATEKMAEPKIMKTIADGVCLS